MPWNQILNEILTGIFDFAENCMICNLKILRNIQAVISPKCIYSLYNIKEWHVSYYLADPQTFLYILFLEKEKGGHWDKRGQGRKRYKRVNEGCVRGQRQKGIWLRKKWIVTKPSVSLHWWIPKFCLYFFQTDTVIFNWVSSWYISANSGSLAEVCM